jgi:hypothetical protein
MSKRRNWVMPREDVPSFLKLLDDRIQSTTIALEHRDSLIRLRAILESDLMRGPFPQHHKVLPEPREDSGGRANDDVLHDALGNCTDLEEGAPVMRATPSLPVPTTA